MVVLALTIFTGVGLVSFFVLNGYLLGREYFELAAMRHMPAADARDLFDRHWPKVFFAGALVAVVVAVPVLNLLTPLFATALHDARLQALRLRDRYARSYERLAASGGRRPIANRAGLGICHTI